MEQQKRWTRRALLEHFLAGVFIVLLGSQQDGRCGQFTIRTDDDLSAQLDGFSCAIMKRRPDE